MPTLLLSYFLSILSSSLHSLLPSFSFSVFLSSHRKSSKSAGISQGKENEVTVDIRVGQLTFETPLCPASTLPGFEI